MDKNEITKMTEPVLKEELKKLREQLYNLRTQTVTEKVADTTSFGNSKREIARVLTEMRSRELKSDKSANKTTTKPATTTKTTKKTTTKAKAKA